MVAACSTRIPLKTVPAQVTVIRHGRRWGSSGPSPPPSPYLQAGDQIRVGATAVLTLAYNGNRYQVTGATLTLKCADLQTDPNTASPANAVLAIDLKSGRVSVRSGPHARRAVVLSREMLAFATVPGTNFVVTRDPDARSTRAWTLGRLIVAAKASEQALRINTRITYTAISDSRGLRLDIWPFAISPRQRATTPADDLPPYWADGLPCSVGCTPAGVTPGWPLEPFHQQHAIRAGINELRPANFHVAVDIEAQNFQPVYAIQSGRASIRYPGTANVNVDVGDFYYWHIKPTVTNGQYVVAYKTMIGRVLYGFYHVAVSQGDTSDYLNPLRPGGSLQPYTNTEPPVIGVPRIFPGGRAIVGAFGPQSLVATGFPYETPVLAPSSLAWRLYDSDGHALTGLEWAMRGSQHYPASLRRVMFAPGASNPGFHCFLTQRTCRPNWVYRLAGGLTEPLPLGGLLPGRYRLTVYAWDWADNKSALDYWFRLPLASADGAPSGAFGPLDAQSSHRR